MGAVRQCRLARTRRPNAFHPSKLNGGNAFSATESHSTEVCLPPDFATTDSILSQQRRSFMSRKFILATALLAGILTFLSVVPSASAQLLPVPRLFVAP